MKMKIKSESVLMSEATVQRILVVLERAQEALKVLEQKCITYEPSLDDAKCAVADVHEMVTEAKE